MDRESPETTAAARERLDIAQHRELESSADQDATEDERRAAREEVRAAGAALSLPAAADLSRRRNWNDTVFLLGSGASVEAGLPTSVDLTRHLVELVRTDLPNLVPFEVFPSEVQRKVISTLDSVYAVLGDDADFEVLVAAARALVAREDSVVGRFVAQWGPEVATVYKEADIPLDIALRVAIRRVLTVNEAERFAYLEPLIRFGNQPKGVTIASLNYDMAIEMQAFSLGIQVDDGFDVLRAGQRKAWPANGIRLMKLHGSINWSDPGLWFVMGEVTNHEAVRSSDIAKDREPPVLIFGRGNKMTPEPLFHGLYVAFLESLAVARRLVIIGYSFRDPHVNVAIANWLKRNPTAEVHVIDPALPDFSIPLKWDPANPERTQGMFTAFGPVLQEFVYLLPQDRVFGHAVGAGKGLRDLLS